MIGGMFPRSFTQSGAAGRARLAGRLRRPATVALQKVVAPPLLGVACCRPKPPSSGAAPGNSGPACTGEPVAYHLAREA